MKAKWIVLLLILILGGIFEFSEFISDWGFVVSDAVVAALAVVLGFLVARCWPGVGAGVGSRGVAALAVNVLALLWMIGPLTLQVFHRETRVSELAGSLVNFIFPGIFYAMLNNSGAQGQAGRKSDSV